MLRFLVRRDFDLILARDRRGGGKEGETEEEGEKKSSLRTFAKNRGGGETRRERHPYTLNRARPNLLSLLPLLYMQFS